VLNGLGRRLFYLSPQPQYPLTVLLFILLFLLFPLFCEMCGHFWTFTKSVT
jgi:hypothetical protein